MYSKQSHNARRGFTLTEAAIVLGIMGLILGAIWVAAAAVYKNIRVARSSEGLLQLTQAVRSLYASASTVESNATHVTYVQAGIFPSDLIENKTSGATRNIWGGDVNVISSAAGGSANTGFTITFTKVPGNACVDFVMRNVGQGSETGLYSYTIHGGTERTTFPATVSSLNTDCANTDGDIAFTFKLQN